jgi:hypothetical protein
MHQLQLHLQVVAIAKEREKILHLVVVVITVQDLETRSLTPRDTDSVSIDIVHFGLQADPVGLQTSSLIPVHARV